MVEMLLLVHLARTVHIYISLYLRTNNVGVGVSNPSYRLEVDGIVSGNNVMGTSFSTTNFTQLWNDGAIMCKTGQYLRFGQVDGFGNAVNWLE
jgi:hypothetical protein